MSAAGQRWDGAVTVVIIWFAGGRVDQHSKRCHSHAIANAVVYILTPLSHPHRIPSPSAQTRISFIVFSHHSYNKLPKVVAEELTDLGFTAAGSDGVDLPYFRRYRIDKKEFDASENNSYFDYQAERAQEKPPPSVAMRVAIECYGLTMARGGGWMSFHAGDAAGTTSTSSSSSSSSSAASASDPTVIELKVGRCRYGLVCGVWGVGCGI